MEVTSHKRVLSILHICYGSICAIIFLSIGGLITAFFPFIESAIIEEEGPEALLILPVISTVIKGILLFIFIFASLPSIIGGIATLNQKKWGMILLTIAGCLSIFSFPFGTALGAYTIYVFVEENKQKNE